MILNGFGGWERVEATTSHAQSLLLTIWKHCWQDLGARIGTGVGLKPGKLREVLLLRYRSGPKRIFQTQVEARSGVAQRFTKG